LREAEDAARASKTAPGVCQSHAPLVDLSLLTAKMSAETYKAVISGNRSVVSGNAEQANANGQQKRDHLVIKTKLGTVEANGSGAVNAALRIAVVALIAWLAYERYQEKQSHRRMTEPPLPALTHNAGGSNDGTRSRP
jgi:hypothetical protein